MEPYVHNLAQWHHMQLSLVPCLTTLLIYGMVGWWQRNPLYVPKKPQNKHNQSTILLCSSTQNTMESNFYCAKKIQTYRPRVGHIRKGKMEKGRKIIRVGCKRKGEEKGWADREWENSEEKGRETVGGQFHLFTNILKKMIMPTIIVITEIVVPSY